MDWPAVSVQPGENDNHAGLLPSVPIAGQGQGQVSGEKSGFPTKEEQKAASLVASAELAKLIRDGKVHLAGIPFAFERIRYIVDQAKAPTSFLSDLYLLAYNQATNGASGTEGVRPETQEYLQQFRTLCHPKTGRIHPSNRALILLSYFEAGDGPTMILPRIDGVLDNAESWQKAEKKLGSRVERLINKRNLDGPDSDLGEKSGR
jgi:hypothetical protein